MKNLKRSRKTKGVIRVVSSAVLGQMDFWQLTSVWIKAVKGRYAGFTPNDLTQIFMRGPFAGWSERELLELANRMDEAQTKFPIWPNDQELSHAAGDSRQPETRSAN